MGRSKTLTTNYPVPQDDSEARSAILEVGQAQRKIVRLEAELNDKVAKLKEQYGAKADVHRARVTELTEGLRMFCEANRARLTRDGRVKHHKFDTGEISWRHRPAKVTLKGIDQILERIREAGLTRFIRVKEEINKEAMLEDRENAVGITGVTIGSDGEDFIVTPDEAALEEAPA